MRHLAVPQPESIESIKAVLLVDVRDDKYTVSQNIENTTECLWCKYLQIF